MINKYLIFTYYYYYKWGRVDNTNFSLCIIATGKDDFLVRVYNRLSAERCLLKGYRGKVVDIAFARLHAVLLGSVDEVGNLLVYDIQTGSDSKLTYPLSKYCVVCLKKHLVKFY